MAHDVFVSYSTKDKNVANAIVAGLEQTGIRCWIAPRDINPGQSWGEAINDAVQGSRFMVIVLSENSNKSRQVVREVERAVANNVIIIPFRIEDIDPTGAMAYFLSTEHWLDALTPPLEKHIKKLTQTIQVFQYGGEQDVLDQKPFIAARPRPKFPVKYILGVIGILSVAVIAIFLIPGLINGGSDNEQNIPTGPSVSSDANVLQTAAQTSTSTPQPVLELLGTWSSSGSTNNIFIEQETAYIANGEEGLFILDISDPMNPQEMGSVELGNVQNVVVQGQVAYVTVQGGVLETTVERDGLIILDVKDPSNPSILGEFSPEDTFVHRSMDSIALDGQIAYLTYDDNVVAVDVSDPAQPELLGQISFESNIVNPGLVVEDGIVYVQTNQLHIFDFRDPGEPVEIGGFDAGWGANLALSDDMLFTAGWDAGLTILDVSDPAKPIKIGSFMELVGNYDLIPQGAASRQTFLDVAVSDTNAYLSYNFGLNQGTWTQVMESGIIAVDISEPTAPQLITKYAELDEISSILAKNDLVYITDSTRGLFILRCP